MNDSPNAEKVIGQKETSSHRHHELAAIKEELRRATHHIMWLRDSEKLSSCIMCGGPSMWNSEDGVTCSESCHDDLVKEAKRGKVHLLKIEESLEEAAKVFNIQTGNESADRMDVLCENIANVLETLLRVPYTQICNNLMDCNEIFRAMNANPTIPSSSSHYLRTLIGEIEARITELRAMHNNLIKILGTPPTK